MKRFLLAVLTLCTTATMHAADVRNDITIDNVIQLMNAERAAYGLQPERTDGLGRALDDFFDRRDALEQMLVEGEVFLVFDVLVEIIFFEGGDTGENEQLALATEAVLALVFVVRATGLTKHGGFGGLEQDWGDVSSRLESTSRRVYESTRRPPPIPSS